MVGFFAKATIILANSTLSILYFFVAEKHASASSSSKYESALIVLMSEMLKFIFSVFLAQRQKKLNPKAVVFYWRRYMLWGIPSLIYFIQNNAANLSFGYIDSPTYSLLGNFRLVVTPLLYLVVMHKRIGAQRWCAILSAFFGVLTSEIACQPSADDGGGSLGGLRPHMIGVFLGLLVPTLSGLSGVITERLMKRPEYADESVHFQNAQLYTFGIACNFLLACRQGLFTHPLRMDDFALKLAVSVLFASIGILTSLTLKYLDSIRKNFTSVFALFGTTIVSSVVRREWPSMPFMMGVCIVSVAQFSYALALQEEERERRRAEANASAC